MKKTLLFAVSAFFSISLSAQDILLFEDFESGGGSFDLNTSDEGGLSAASGSNQWIVNNWYTEGFGTDTDCSFSDLWCQPVPAQDPGISSTDGNYLHIYSDLGNDFCFNQNCNVQSASTACSGEESYFAAMNSDISTTGYSDVTLDFWWLCEGSSFSYGELWYSTDGGTSWIQYTSVADYEGQLTWDNEVLTDVAWEGQATLRFGFRFVNDFDFSGYYNLIGWGIDDVEISATVGGGCTNTTSSFTVSACDSYTVPSGDETYTTGGTYNDTIPNAEGCDSIMTITVEIGAVDITVTDNFDGSLTANASGGGITYQWIDCETDLPLTGETDQTLDVLNGGYANGYYAVIITDGSCSDTSECILVEVEGVEETSPVRVKVYPVPASEFFSVSLGNKEEKVELKIIDITGKTVRSSTYSNVETIKNVTTPTESGVYFVHLKFSSGQVITKRLIRK